MRILAPNGTVIATATPTARRATGTGFTVEEENAPRSTAPAGGPRAVGGIDALIALQGVEDPLERRKRGVKRGRIALAFSAATLSNLRSAAAQLKLSSGDPDLDAVLAEIELRVEVEIAKMAQR
jgi:Class II flagellar assembly regulator